LLVVKHFGIPYSRVGATGKAGAADPEPPGRSRLGQSTRPGAVVDHKIGDFKVEYLGEFESICKKALTRISEAQMELCDKKTRGRKSRDTVPLMEKFYVSKV
jgi:hypothetical protein